MKDKKTWILILIAFYIMMSGLYRFSRSSFADYFPKVIFYNRTASLPLGWYLRVPCLSINVGDIVVFDAPDSVKQLAVSRGWMDERDQLMKKVGALEGDSYVVSHAEKKFFARGKYVGSVFRWDKDGNELPRIDGEFVVPKGEFLPVTSHPFSFDGRYYGTVPLKNIKYKVVPVPFLTD